MKPSRTDRLLLLVPLLGLFAAGSRLDAQTPERPDVAAQIQQLNQLINKTQAQLEQSQRDLDSMRRQVAALGAQMSSDTEAGVSSASKPVDEQLEDLREEQQVQQSEIATHEQAKVETLSKFPLRLSGLVLFNAFGNTSAVDWAATPSLAESGPGSTGMAIRQTILGLDAAGPHLWGAESYADLHLDFDGQPQSNTSNYSGVFYQHNTLVRLRTAHAGLRWPQAELWAGFDRSILVPNVPTSLTATSTPPLAWSGNLWAWNPQLGVRKDVVFSNGRALQLQGALIDVQDALLPPLSASSTTVRSLYSPLSEQSRSPGVEGRIALVGSLAADHVSRAGVGVYFAPHRLPDASRYSAWAVTWDTQLQLPGHFEFTASAYRGAALGGLGAGGYKDFAYTPDSDRPGSFYYLPLDDVGGWAQLKQRTTRHMELNAAFGIDNPFASQLRSYPISGSSAYQTLARNRTATGNVIVSPSAYLSFSFEYRHIMSSPLGTGTLTSDIFGAAAGYRF